MAEHSILYMGRGDFAPEYLAELETLPCCTMLTRSPELTIPVDDHELIEIVLLEASPLIAQSCGSLAALIHSLRDYPVVASVAQAAGITSADQLVFPLTVTFVAAAIIAGMIRLLLAWVNTGPSGAIASPLGIT